MHFSQDQSVPSKGPGLLWHGATQPPDGVIATSGVTFQLWRLYQHAWLVCLLFPFVSLASEASVSWHFALGLIALLFFAIGYTWLMWPHPVSSRAQARPRLAFLLFVALSLLVLVFSLVDGPAWLWLFIGVSAIAGMMLPMRSAFAAVVLFTLLPLFIIVGMKGGIVGVEWWWLIALMLLVRGLGLDMIGVARMSSAIRALHTARRELARLKVEEERVRLARDLHDLLGHTLSMITLKSELARLLIREDPDRCAQELSEIEQVARQTLREVREAVAGYRQPRLESELNGARQLLEAARIDAQIEMTTGELPPVIDAILAWTVREGVTNVIRHSRAQHCFIRLTREHESVCAEVINDEGQGAHVESTAAKGVGLSGLRERVAALGGRMEAGPLTMDDQGRFRLHVELPIQSDVKGQASWEEQQ